MSDSSKPTPVQQPNVWIKEHDSKVPSIENIRMRVGDVEANFVVSARNQLETTRVNFMISVTTEESVDYVIDGLVTVPINGRIPGSMTDFPFKLTRDKSTCNPLGWQTTKPAEIRGSVVVKLVFKEIQFRKIYPLPDAGLKLYIERGPNVLLVGSDGSVTVPMRALKIRSETFEAMFKHDCKEKETGEVDLKDFDKKTLDAFSYFVATGEIKDGKETALGLILLGDKYNIQDLKELAENFVKDNFDGMNQEDVVDVFSKVGRESVKQAMKAAWTKK